MCAWRRSAKLPCRRTEMKFATLGVHHLTVRVNNLTASIAFYRDLLGFDVAQPSDDLALFVVGQTYVVLRPPLPGTPAASRVVDERVGFDHGALRVAEADELHKLVCVLSDAGVVTARVERDPVL